MKHPTPYPPRRSLRGAIRAANRHTAAIIRGPKRGAERGFALLMVTITTLVLGAYSVQFSYNLNANSYMAGNLVASTKAYYNARSAQRIALLAVNAKQNFPQMKQFMDLMGPAAARIEIWQRACDFVDIFATGKAVFFGSTMLDFSTERAVGADSGLEDTPGFSCKVSAEDARVDLNRAATEPPLPTLGLGGGMGANAAMDPAQQAATAFQTQQGQAAQLYVQLGGLLEPMIHEGYFKDEDEILDLIMNIIDWTDADSSKTGLDHQGNFTTGGSEFDYGRYGYQSKDAKMDTVGEVQLVEGMTSEVFCQIRDKLTVFATDKINVNDADLAVLKGVLCQSIADETLRSQLCVLPGMSGLAPIDDALLAMDSCRELKKQVYSTPFTSMSRFISFFTSFPEAMNTGVPLPIAPNVVNQQLGVRTNMVRIETEGIFGDTKRKMVSVVNTDTGALVHYHYE